MPTSLTAAEQVSLLKWLDTVAEPRVEQYMQLLSMINGHTPEKPTVPAFEWFAESLRAHR
ncbi:hypothetical protein ACIRRA_42755 [Nocardia sp. NPDC101769]|uniref:hypothetical protein n=1 Tax=Nocardia sp. NPDC101769 TaxID=3364333 RepID=UPI0038270847